MSENQEEKKKEPSNKLIDKINKVIPGFGSFFEKAEGTKTFGARMKQIRDEMNRRFKGKF